jgi:hypothetical protein
MYSHLRKVEVKIARPRGTAYAIRGNIRRPAPATTRTGDDRRARGTARRLRLLGVRADEDTTAPG